MPYAGAGLTLNWFDFDEGDGDLESVAAFSVASSSFSKRAASPLSAPPAFFSVRCLRR
jgi:hypothetical protein